MNSSSDSNDSNNNNNTNDAEMKPKTEIVAVDSGNESNESKCNEPLFKFFKTKYKSADFAKNFAFIRNLTFKKRLEISNMKRTESPTKVPIIVEKDFSASKSGKVHRYQFFVPRDLKVSDLIINIKKQDELKPTEALFLFVGNTIPLMSMTIGEFDRYFCCDDGFVYVTYTQESTFG